MSHPRSLVIGGPVTNLAQVHCLVNCAQPAHHSQTSQVPGLTSAEGTGDSGGSGEYFLLYVSDLAIICCCFVERRNCLIKAYVAPFSLVFSLASIDILIGSD